MVMERMTYSQDAFVEDRVDVALTDSSEVTFDELLRQYLALFGNDLSKLAQRLDYPDDFVAIWMEGKFLPIVSEQARLRARLESRA
jgi:hypothetical protein